MKNNISMKKEDADAITSVKEFITTLICLHLHSYFIIFCVFVYDDGEWLVSWRGKNMN